MIRSFKGKTPRIHPTAFVSETAYVIGDVDIGEGSSIWPGTVIRADVGPIHIGKFTNIQDNSVVHTDSEATIGDYVTLGHAVVCHARKIGNHVLIGNKAVLNDPAEIGDNCIVGAASLVLEGFIVPSNSFALGSPAVVRGPCTEKHLALIDRIWKIYTQKGQWFNEAGLGDKIPGAPGR